MVATDDDKEALDLDVRRRDLERRLVEKGVLKESSTGQASQAESTGTEKKQLGQAVKLASEFLAAVVVGVVLGLGFDQITGFAPWGMVVFLFLGVAAGVLNMLRAIGAVEPYQAGHQHQGERQKGDKSPD